MRWIIEPAAMLRGAIRPPSDKSLTHRAYMLGAIAEGPSIVREPLEGEDCEATLACLVAMGLRVERGPGVVRLFPASEWGSPKAELDCGNSGTTMRLLAGLIASRPIAARMVGDHSLSRRPMGRVAEPLRRMGARIEGDRPPLLIEGGDLVGIDHRSEVASAQVKSCLLLAGLRAQGATRVTEPSLSRDHTERMLRARGVTLKSGESSDGSWVEIEGGQRPAALDQAIPADISSAAFLLVASAMRPGSEVALTGVGVNPTRTGVLDVLAQTGVVVELTNETDEGGEPTADLVLAAPPRLRPFRIEGALVPRLIDEIPVLAVLATQCEGTSIIRDARELRVKESDRIEEVAAGLRAMGAEVETFEDGLAVLGPCRLRRAAINAKGDHRVALAFAVAGLVGEGATIDGVEAVETSYPGFLRHLEHLRVV